MASLTRDTRGNIRIQFVGKDGRRYSIRPGRLNKRTGEDLKQRVEHLVAVAAAGLRIDTETAAWLERIDDSLINKLAAVGLVQGRNSQTVSQFVADYIATRTDAKPTTRVNMQRVAADLATVYGNADLRVIGPVEAEKLKAFYHRKGLAGATAHRRLKMARMFFARAVEAKLIPENPFRGVRARNVLPAGRRHYISHDDTRRLLDAANPTWRTIIALARYAGLRCPSEVLSLTWENVDLPAGRMVVLSPKTEHLPGRENRIVPVFAALRPHLEEAWDLAAERELCVVGGDQGDRYRQAGKGKGGWQGSNLRTSFERIINRAGLKPWPRLFHNLRASCETDLMAQHPIQVVAAWMGHTPDVALLHYLQTLPTDFAKATGVVQNAAQTGVDTEGPKPTVIAGKVLNVPICPIKSTPVLSSPSEQMTLRGLEHTDKAPCLSGVCPMCGADLGSLDDKQQVVTVTP